MTGTIGPRRLHVGQRLSALLYIIVQYHTVLLLSKNNITNIFSTAKTFVSKSHHSHVGSAMNQIVIWTLNPHMKHIITKLGLKVQHWHDITLPWDDSPLIVVVGKPQL